MKIKGKSTVKCATKRGVEKKIIVAPRLEKSFVIVSLGDQLWGYL